MISAPGDKDVDATVVFGVNHKIPQGLPYRDLQC